MVTAAQFLPLRLGSRSNHLQRFPFQALSRRFMGSLNSMLDAKMLHRLINKYFKGNRRQSIGKYIPQAGDERMEMAFTLARNTFPEVIDKLKKGEIPEVSVKLRATNGNDFYYYWVVEVRVVGIANEKYIGVVNNEDRRFPGIKMGQSVEFTAHDIYDWLYEKNGKYFGNYTLKTMAYITRDPVKLSELNAFGDYP